MRQRIRLGLLVLIGLVVSLWLALQPDALVQATEPGVRIGQTPPMTESPPDESEPPQTQGNAANGATLKPFDEVVKDLEVSEGYFNLYRDPERPRALLGIKPQQLNQNLLLIATLESGLGEAGLFRGWPINDLMIQFRQAPDNKLHVVVPNVYFRHPHSRPQDRQLLQESFSDSMLFVLNVISIHPDTGEMLIDLGNFLIDRDPANLTAAFSWALGGYSLNPEASYLGEIKAFPNNLELETVLGYSGGGGGGGAMALFFRGLTTLPDARGFSLRVRYSLSPLPNNPAYQPRAADERVGYFITAYRAPVRQQTSDPFVRYIHRWHLEKQDPSAAISPVKQPIVFWIENTVPDQYRGVIREGIELWNIAFEQAGFKDAVQVRQMPANADWDPADVRYNVVRWSDSFFSGILGLGPSRVNPLTGEILDADVVLDAGVIGYLNQQYRTFEAILGSEAETAMLQLCGHPLEGRLIQRLGGDPAAASPPGMLANQVDYCAGFKASQQMAFGALALNTLAPPFETQAAREKYIQQFLRSLTAHEIGHVLGLRHNFLGSTLLAPDHLNDVDKTRTMGMVSSVMDYLPPNLALPGQPQGDYFPTTLGPYDRWAIEYGYKPVSGPGTAQRQLQQIAARSGGSDLAYAADEDIWDFIDPKAAAWDLSSDPLGYAQGQLANAHAIWDRLNWFSLNPGESYGQLRRRVDLVFEYYLHQAMTISNYIGGQRFNRTDPWASRGQRPFEPLSGTEQRRALETLRAEVFAADALQFSPEFLNLLAPDRWWHWGKPLTVYPLDYPIYNRILFVQAIALSDVLYGERLIRLRDAELRTIEAEPFTLAELFDTLSQTIWAEVLTPGPDPTPMSSLRRGLQRHHLNILTSLFLRNPDAAANAPSLLEAIAIDTTYGAPEDARLLARYHLRQLQGAVANYLRRHGQRLDVTTQAYLEDVSDRITAVLNAPLIRQ
ncbi:zinc-dependent metalloprotease [Nodosilinea sp. P-1105]|uniref:zinc-dependent metalloprotease n=1 Tax=Nodosilinea sp. P-1105 TaxID=2546229 RepID=UPI00197CC2D4|nr:zinc-dependent metalloprotease [Nodosilinea sp. P-1105]